MLALVSSIIALNISLLKAENQRERNFLASKAFLPAALSELTAYFEESALLLKQGWASETGSKPGIKLPPLPKEYKSVFADCIRHATPDVGDYLSQILVWLQVHDSRLRGYASQDQENGQFRSQQNNLIQYFFRLGQLQAMVNKLFDFSRNMAEFDSNSLEWEDFHTAYANLRIWESEIRIADSFDLEEYTKRKIANACESDWFHP